MSSNGTWKGFLQERRQSHIDELVELLRIPSVSTDDASVSAVLKAADWVAARLSRAGVENVKIEPTGKHACVVGDWLHAPGKPTVLIYGHFDVQPPDPLDLWDSPPFEPVIKDGRIYARGTTDMKANLLLCITAIEAVLAASGSLPVNVKFLFEGQEEIGSRDLGPYVAARRKELACDLVLSADGLQWGEDQPSVWMGVKGLCALQIDVEALGMDLHSGIYGGAVPNAAHELVSLLGTMRSPDGRILVEGFYDEVRELTQADRAEMDSVPFDESAYRASVGADVLVGEPGYSTYERTWVRPTMDVNGMWSGYQGDGVKTVIPAKAHAKITCRLVADQDPATILDKIQRHIERNTRPGIRVKLTRSPSSARPYEMDRDNPGVQAMAEVLAAVYGRPPYYVRIGGSLPITDMFLQELNAFTVSLGFGLEDERAHSPNEFFRLASFERGQEVYARALDRLGQLEPGSMAAR